MKSVGAWPGIDMMMDKGNFTSQKNAFDSFCPYQHSNPIWGPHQCINFYRTSKVILCHKRQEIIAGDEDGGNNTMECDASNGIIW